jgi:hydroxyacylglutathione hydrolase
MPYQLIALPCRTDNYIWLIRNATHAWVIDPSLAEPVRDYISQHGLILADILITHHHHDHVGGIAELSPWVTGRIIGDSERIAGLTENIHAPCSLKLSNSDIVMEVLATAGHTFDHISYYCPHLLQTGVLFCGDTLFSAGCGRIFDGSMQQLFDSFVRIMQLPNETQIACAHEYTEANLDFALAIQAAHLPTQNHLNQVKYARANGMASLPSTLAIEKQINPYCRAIAHPDDTDWVAGLKALASKHAHTLGKMDATNFEDSAFELFSLCRLLKNGF